MLKPLRLIACLFVLMLSTLPAAAQQDYKHGAPVWQVFLLHRKDKNSADKLVFINILTGEEKRADVNGERYTPISGGVMYYDPKANRVMVIAPTGEAAEHPFIQPGANTRRVDWLVSPDNKLLVWTLTDAQDSKLTTITTLANIDGTNPRQILTDGPRDGIRALPVAFSAENTTLYMDFQPDGIADFTPFRQYAGLFALDLTTDKWAYLSGEPGCFCGAGFGAGLLLRLNVSRDLSGFDLRVVDINGQVEHKIPALNQRNFTQAGDVVVSPDGSKAVYALAQVKAFGTANQSVRTIFVLVDLQTMTQSALTQPITTFVQPLAWTEDNTAVVFTSRQRDGTWKVSLDNGKLDKVAEATYLGTLK